MLSLVRFAHLIRPPLRQVSFTPCAVAIRGCRAYTSSRAPQKQYGGQQANCSSKAATNARQNTVMASSVVHEEAKIRQVIAASLKSSLGVPQHSWSQDFVIETILSELVIASQAPSSNSNSSSNSSDSEPSQTPAPSQLQQQHTELAAAAAPANHSSKLQQQQQQRQKISKRHSKAAKSVKPTAAAHNATSTADVSSSSSSAEVLLAPDVAELLDAYMAATGDSNDDSSSSSSISPVVHVLQSKFSQLLYDNFHQVEEEDVRSFCTKLLQESAALVRSVAESQSAAEEGLCALCGRDMPLTKHHLIPRDVHKEFKKRGYTFAQLQSGLLVCRPCHSAIHRAVPDNKQLALQFSTLEALRQNCEIAKFAAWAQKQRVSSKADATLKHHRYRR